MDLEDSNNEIKMKEMFSEDFSGIEKKNESDVKKPHLELKEASKTKKNKEKKNYSLNHYLKEKIDKIEPKEILFIKSYLYLIIQFIIIFIFTLLGFLFEINKEFIKSKGAFYGTFISTTILIFVMCYTFMCIPDSKRGDYGLYIYLILYIPCIVFYCFVLSKYTDNKHILCGLILYILDILSFFIIILFFEKIYYILVITFSLITTIITLLIFHLAWIKDDLITFKITIIGLFEILYLFIITALTIRSNNEYFIIETIIFDLAFFYPFAILFFAALLS